MASRSFFVFYFFWWGGGVKEKVMGAIYGLKPLKWHSFLNISVKHASNTNLVNNMVNSENISGTSMKDETLNDAVKTLKGRIVIINKLSWECHTRGYKLS